MDETSVAESTGRLAATRGQRLYTGSIIALGIFFLALALFRPPAGEVCVQALVTLRPLPAETPLEDQAAPAGETGVDSFREAPELPLVAQQLLAALRNPAAACKALSRAEIIDDLAGDPEAADTLAQTLVAQVRIDPRKEAETGNWRLRWSLPATSPLAESGQAARAADSVLDPLRGQQLVLAADRIVSACRALQNDWASDEADADVARAHVDALLENAWPESLPGFWLEVEQAPRVIAAPQASLSAIHLLLLMGPALVLGALAAFWSREAAPPETFYSPQDVSDWLDLPVLGSVSTGDGPEICLPLPPQSPAIVGWMRAACELSVLFSLLLVVICAASVANFSSMLLQDPFAAFHWAVDYVWSARPW